MHRKGRTWKARRPRSLRSIYFDVAKADNGLAWHLIFHHSEQTLLPFLWIWHSSLGFLAFRHCKQQLVLCLYTPLLLYDLRERERISHWQVSLYMDIHFSSSLHFVFSAGQEGVEGRYINGRWLLSISRFEHVRR